MEAAVRTVYEVVTGKVRGGVSLSVMVMLGTCNSVHRGISGGRRLTTILLNKSF
jgi:hypothetical protein